MNILVSIIVPCYNQAHFLSEALQSVLNQTYPNWECIIVNDGSPDNTYEVSESWCKKDRRFIYLEKENCGLSSARNSGIKISNGEFILPLDADDILHHEYLSKLLPELVNNENLSIVSCYREYFSKDKSNVFYQHKPKGASYRNFLFENILMPSSLYRKACWEEIGGYDESMNQGFEDWEFWLSIVKRGHKYKIIEEFLFYYRKSKDSMLVDTLKNHRIDVMKYVFKKHKEIYLENYDNTIEYLFFLLNMYRKSELKYKFSLEQKIGEIICKPYRVLQKLIFKNNTK